MICGVLTLLLGAAMFVMFTQPLFWAYSGEGKELANEIYKRLSCYDGIVFEKGQDTMYTIACVFMIIAMVLGGIMMLLTLLNLIGRATGSTRLVGTKLVSLFFFLTILASLVLFAIYMRDVSEGGLMKINVGYGLIGATVAAFLSFIFSPRSKKS